MYIYEFYHQHFVPVCLSRVQKSTRYLYQQVINLWIDWVGNSDIQKITPADCEKFVASSLEHVGPFTVAKYCWCMNAMFLRMSKPGWRNRKAFGFVQDAPYCEPPKLQQALPKQVKDTDIVKLIAALADIKDFPKCVDEHLRPKWWRALVIFAASTNVDPNIINDLYVYFEVDINGVRQSNDVKLVNSGGTLNLDSALAELAQTFATCYGGQKAVYDPGFKLRWWCYVGSDYNNDPIAWVRNAGTSTSCLYVTYDTPSPGSELYHTVVHIGCRAANGQTTEQNVFKEIWKKFEQNSTTGSIDIYRVVIENGAVVPSKAGNELYYYGIAQTPPAGWVPAFDTPSSPANQYSISQE